MDGWINRFEEAERKGFREGLSPYIRHGAGLLAYRSVLTNMLLFEGERGFGVESACLED